MYVPVEFDLLREKETGEIVQVVDTWMNGKDAATVNFIPVINKDGEVISDGTLKAVRLSEMYSTFDLLENLSYFNVRESGQMDFGSMVVVHGHDELNKLTLAYYEFLDQPIVTQYLEPAVEYPALAVVMNQAVFVESVNKVSKIIQSIKG